MRCLNCFGLVGLSVLMLTGCATSPDPEVRQDPTPQYDLGVSATLTPFGSETAFFAFVERWDARPYVPEAPSLYEIVVTGGRIVPSVTNNQVSNVDEGGVVKQIGDRIIVLRDGRLFVLNIGRAGESPRLESRVDLYENPDEDTWFDEVLVSDKRIIVVGYSYQYKALSYSVLELDEETGSVTPIGRFLMGGGDYFDGRSYAARLIGDSIVFETPISIFDLDPDRQIVPGFFKPDADGDGDLDGHTPFFGLEDVYQPVVEHSELGIQVVVRCEVETMVRDGPDAACQAVAFMTHEWGDLYVGEDYAYYWPRPAREWWAQPERCQIFGADDVGPTPVFRIELETMALSVAGGFGRTLTPLWMHERDGDLFATTQFYSNECATRDDQPPEPLRLGLISLNASAFSETYTPADPGGIRSLPEMSGSGPYYAVRFFEDTLFYGQTVVAPEWRGPTGDPLNTPIGSTLMSIDLNDARTDYAIALNHSLSRIEPAGDDYAVTVGDSSSDFPVSVAFSVIDLEYPWEVAAAGVAPDRVEAEWRSHAYNATTFEDDESQGHILALATLSTDRLQNEMQWRAEGAGVSFMGIREGEMVSFGSVDPDAIHPDDSYECEVSCVDWYGVVRAFYFNDRVFALTDIELIEVDVLSGPQLTVLNRTRLDLPLDAKAD